MENKSKKGARMFFLIMLVISIALSVVNWSVISDGGNVEIERLYLSGKNGDRISALLYKPANATEETPAPAFICIHGNAGSGRNHESWAVELVRRGFVVISPDLFGSGDSEESAKSFESIEFYLPTPIAAYDHLLTLNYVDKDNIIVGSHSMGGAIAAALAAKYNAKGVVSASGNSTGNNLADESWVQLCTTWHGNTLMDFGTNERGEEKTIGIGQSYLESKADYAPYQGVKYEAIDQQVGSFETNDFFMVSMTLRVHEAAFVEPQFIEKLLWFSQEAVDEVPNYIDPADQVWQVKDYLGLAGTFAFGLLICAFALLLIEEIPAFAEVKRPVARNIGLRNVGMAISIILGLIFPYIVLKTAGLGIINLLGMSSKPPMIHNPALFRLTYANVSMGLVVGLNIMGILGFCIYYFTDGKKHKLELQDLGLTPAGTNKLSVSMILKTLLLSMIVILSACTFLYLQEQILGTTYYSWFFGFKAVPVFKFKYYIPYMIVWMICFLVASMTLNVERRLPSTGKEWLDIVIQIVFNIICATLTIIIIIRVDWVSSTNGVKLGSFFTYATDITRTWGMPVGMGVGVMGSTLLYRKTGNAWLSAILMGSVSALMCCMYSQIRMW